MRRQELNQVQRLKNYQRPGYVQFVEKEKICLKYINKIRKNQVKRVTESVTLFCRKWYKERRTFSSKIENSKEIWYNINGSKREVL